MEKSIVKIKLYKSEYEVIYTLLNKFRKEVELNSIKTVGGHFEFVKLFSEHKLRVFVQEVRKSI